MIGRSLRSPPLRDHRVQIKPECRSHRYICVVHVAADETAVAADDGSTANAAAGRTQPPPAAPPAIQLVAARATFILFSTLRKCISGRQRLQFVRTIVIEISKFTVSAICHSLFKTEQKHSIHRVWSTTNNIIHETFCFFKCYPFVIIACLDSRKRDCLLFLCCKRCVQESVVQPFTNFALCPSVIDRMIKVIRIQSIPTQQ